MSNSFDAPGLPLPLAELSPIPIHHPDCCLSLSTTLISTLRNVVLSVTPSSSHTAVRATDETDELNSFKASIDDDFLQPDEHSCTVKVTANEETKPGNGDQPDQDTHARVDRTIRVLSVGSGTGVLEALLLASFTSSSATLTPTVNPPSHGHEASESNVQFEIIGLEVPDLRNKMNRYLPLSSRQSVNGTWDIPKSLARKADMWMFVYPRERGLVERYLELLPDLRERGETLEENGEVEDGADAKMVIWAGPRNDWMDYEGLFEKGLGNRGWKLEVSESDEMGVAEYEVVCVARKEMDLV